VTLSLKQSDRGTKWIAEMEILPILRQVTFRCAILERQEILKFYMLDGKICYPAAFFHTNLVDSFKH